MYAEQLNELYTLLINYHMETNQEHKNETKLKLCSVHIPVSMMLMEDKLRTTSTGYLIGDSITWVDLFLYNILEILGQSCSLILEKFCLLKAHFYRIKNMPQIAYWLENRPKSDI